MLHDVYLLTSDVGGRHWGNDGSRKEECSATSSSPIMSDVPPLDYSDTMLALDLVREFLFRSGTLPDTKLFRTEEENSLLRLDSPGGVREFIVVVVPRDESQPVRIDFYSN